MIAIPVSNLGENAHISEYFGQSKWFAFFDEGTISFEKNKYSNGCKIVDWLYEMGVTKTIISHIGLNPFLKLNEMKIECLYVNYEEENNLSEVLEQLQVNQLPYVTLKNKSLAVDLENGCNEIC